MSYSLYQHETFQGAREQAQGAVRDSQDAIQAFPGRVNGIPSSGVGAGCVALDSIAGGIGANQPPLQFSAAIDVAHRQFGNRATLQFVHQQQVHHVAQSGLRDAGQPYPFSDEIQRSFGQHDISGLEGHTGEAARAANSELGSTAYHKGGHVAFGREPTLADAAHEAAHYVQGVGATQLKGGVGQPGDVYERRADRVAEAVVAGESAESLLEQSPPGGGATSDAPVQMTGGSLSRASGQGGRKEEEEPKQKEVVRLDQSEAAQRIDSLTGPLPGPPDHTDFGIIQYTQARTIRPGQGTVHVLVGVYRTSERGGYFTELTGNLGLRNREDYPTVMEWIKASPVRVHEIVPTRNIAYATIIVPIDNLDEVHAYMRSALIPEKGEIAESQFTWIHNSQDESGHVTRDRTTCFHYVAEVANKMKLNEGGFASPTDQFTFKESHELFMDLAERGYLRFQDAPDTTERVRNLHEDFDKDWEPALKKWPSEVPLRRFPDPETYNAARGFVPKHHPRQSLMDKAAKVAEDPRNRYRLEGYIYSFDDKKDDPKFAEFFPNQRKK